MLYQFLFEQIYPFLSPLRVVGYITVRSALATLTALAIGLILGPWLIRKLQQAQIGQYIREEGPESHQAKAGTPTMGGLLICLAAIVPTMLWANLANPYIWIALLAMAGFGAVGFIDDYSKISNKRNLGLRTWTKFGMQGGMTLVICGLLYVLNDRGHYAMEITLPFFKDIRPDPVIHTLTAHPLTVPFAYILFFGFLFLVLVGSTNAVNLTDGLDGLAIGLAIICVGALTALVYISGHSELSSYLDIPYVPLAGELTIFCASIVGASLAFLWYNAHPAQIFMGDVGSLSLGGAIGTVAVLAKQEIVLLFIGGIFVIETLSVIGQVASFKLTGKRILRMSPLHHHFEQIGWPESKVIVRFWIAGFVWALLAISTLKLR